MNCTVDLSSLHVDQTRYLLTQDKIMIQNHFLLYYSTAQKTLFFILHGTLMMGIG